jgi:hypothetical protein
MAATQRRIRKAVCICLNMCEHFSNRT